MKKRVLLILFTLALGVWGFCQERSNVTGGRVRKPQMSDTLKANMYADNWTDDVELDNTVIFRRTVTSPPDGKTRPDFSKLNNQVPDQPPPRGGKKKSR